MNIWLGLAFLSRIPPARGAANFDQFPLTRGKKINESAGYLKDLKAPNWLRLP